MRPAPGAGAGFGQANGAPLLASMSVLTTLPSSTFTPPAVTMPIDPPSPVLAVDDPATSAAMTLPGTPWHLRARVGFSLSREADVDPS